MEGTPAVVIAFDIKRPKQFKANASLLRLSKTGNSKSKTGVSKVYNFKTIHNKKNRANHSCKIDQASI